MKVILLLSIAISILAQLGNAAAQSVDDLVQQLRTTIVATDMAEVPISEEIAATTPEQRKKLLAAILHIIEETFRTPQPRSYANDKLIGTCACVLAAVSDENATLEAFGSRLTQVGFNSEPWVIRALARCRDPKAVETIADLARLRLKELRQLLPQLPPPGSLTEEQKIAYGDIFGSMFSALKGLAHSANSSGKAVARELRDEFIKAFDGSPRRKGILRDLAAEVDPLLREAPQPALPRSHSPVPTPTAQPKQIGQPKPE